MNERIASELRLIGIYTSRLVREPFFWFGVFFFVAGSVCESNLMADTPELLLLLFGLLVLAMVVGVWSL